MRYREHPLFLDWRDAEGNAGVAVPALCERRITHILDLHPALGLVGRARVSLPLLELARVLMRFDHVASVS